MSGKTIPPGILHPREPDTCAFAEHEDGHTKMAAFKIPGPTATVFMGVLAGRGDSACSSIAVVPSQASPILKEIARLDALAAQGCTIDDRVYRPRASASLGPSMPTRRSGRHSSERIRRLLAQDAALARKAGDASEFENTLVSIVKMAYKLTTARAARSQTDIMGGQIIVNHNFGGTENGKTRRASPCAVHGAAVARRGVRYRE